MQISKNGLINAARADRFLSGNGVRAVGGMRVPCGGADT